MKILFVAPRFHTNLFLIIKTLLEKDHQVHFHVACTGPTEDHSLLVPSLHKQCKLSLLIEKIFGKDAINRRYYFPWPMSYWNRFKKLKPDLVIIRDPYKLFPLLAALCAKLINAKIIFYTQEDLFKARKKRSLWKQRMVLLFFKAAWITPINSTNAPDNSGAWKHVYHIPLPVYITSMNTRQINCDLDGPRILMVGKYHQARKKHLLFLQALDKLKDRYRFKVTIAGECVSQEQQQKFSAIQAAAEQMQLAGMVELKQNVPYHQMGALYAGHHIFVLPSINEQYGVSVNEAMGYALPVICTDTCGARFHIVNGHNGFVIKSNNLEELTTSLEKMMADHTRLNQMRYESLLYASEHFSEHAFYKKFARITRERFSLTMA
jgi:glycosyltransferase involved in cell wall biosynthesis